MRHQFSHGLTFQAAYTWDKDLSDIFFGNSANINNANCLMCQYGPVSFNRAHRLAVNYSYDLPMGKGMSGFAGKAIGGWNVSGVTIAQTGDYLTFFWQNASARGGDQHDELPDRTSDAGLLLWIRPARPQEPG